MIRDELIWASGLFEGEGCISSSAKSHRPHLMLGSTDLDVLIRFHIATGELGTIYPVKLVPGHKPMFQWNLTRFEGVQAVVAMLWFGLGQRRRERARYLFTAYITHVDRRLGPRGSYGKPYSQTRSAKKSRAFRARHATVESMPEPMEVG